MRSCLALAVEADGAEIVTLEGANTRKWTQRLQKKFHEKNAFQCGFCAPGVILSATELLEKDPSLDRTDRGRAVARWLMPFFGHDVTLERLAAG